MTKTQTNSRRVPIYRRPITIIILAVILIGIAIAVFCLLRSTKNDNPADSSSVVPVNTPADYDDQSAVENPPDKTVQFEGEDPNTLEELTGSITRRTIANGELTVVASIDQYLTVDSSCQLFLKNQDGVTEVRKTDSLTVTAEATSSVCGPFTVPVSQLSGTYIIDIVITSPDKSGHIITEINI